MPDIDYGYRGRSFYDDCSESDGGDHTMGEVHETYIEATNWVGPDDQFMTDFRFNFDIDNHLLGDNDSETMFGEDPTRQDYESYTGNAGPTLDYWYHVASVVFWPRSMNMKVLKSAGSSYVVSYLNVASPSEIPELGSYIVTLLESRKLTMSATVLSRLCKANDESLVLRALKCCQRIPSGEYARALALLPRHFHSPEIRAEVLDTGCKEYSCCNQATYIS